MSSSIPIVNSADFIKIDRVLPGVTPPPPEPVNKFNTVISKRELEFIARNTDLITRRIPLAVTVYALFDFFFIGGNDVWSDELEEDRGKIAVDWMMQSAIRVGVALLVLMATILVSHLTYFPL